MRIFALAMVVRADCGLMKSQPPLKLRIFKFISQFQNGWPGDDERVSVAIARPDFLELGSISNRVGH
jgi:hypothetical protein